MVNRGLAALTAGALVGNDGTEVFTTEMELATTLTQDTELSTNDLLTKKDAIYKEMLKKTNVDLVQRLKGLVSYIEKDPRLSKKSVFIEVADLMQQIEAAKVNQNQNTNEQTKTM